MSTEGIPPLDTAVDIWEYFLQSQGVQPANYDDALIGELRGRLQLPADGDFSYQLRSFEVTPERFVPALFRSLAPFARMMSDLCAFFVRHDVAGNGNGLRIAFDFTLADQSLEFDLEHFRRWLDAFTSAWGTVHEYAWSLEKLSELRTILNEASRSSLLPPSQVGISLWLQPETRERDEPWLDGLPVVPMPSGVSSSIRRSIDRVQELVRSVMQARSTWFSTYGELDAWRSNRYSPVDYTVAEPISRWSVNSIVALEHDCFCGYTMRSLWAWMHELSFDKDSAVHEKIARRLNELFDSLSPVPTETRVPLNTLLSALELPVWGQRSALYAAWLLTVIEDAFDGSPVVIHHRGGVLRIGAKETHIATFQLGLDDIDLVAESYSPVGQPEGAGRTRGIKPDYVLRPKDQTDTARTHVVIEAKQYLRPNARLFADAINDYAKGHPNAEIVLLDYGRMSASVTERVHERHRPRAHALGNVQPLFPEDVRNAKIIISSPMARAMGNDMIIIVDVSGSMGQKLRNEQVLGELRLLAARFGQATWVACDTQVRVRDKGPAALEMILALNGGGTDLRAALVLLETGPWLVVTDGEGLPQVTAFAPDCDVRTLGDGIFVAGTDARSN